MPFRDIINTTRRKKNAYISQGSVEKICRALDCALDDIVEFMPDDAEGKQYDA